MEETEGKKEEVPIQKEENEEEKKRKEEKKAKKLQKKKEKKKEAKKEKNKEKRKQKKSRGGFDVLATLSEEQKEKFNIFKKRLGLIPSDEKEQDNAGKN